MTSPMKQTPKQASVTLIATLRQSLSHRHLNWARRLARCGEVISLVDKRTGVVRQRRHHCKVPICPKCQWITQHTRVNKVKSWTKNLAKYPDLAYLYLSVGFRPFQVAETPAQVKLLKAGFKELIHRSKLWPGVGCLTVRESSIKGPGLVRFDTHSLIAVSADYFASGKELLDSEWAEEIRIRFKLDYLPAADVQRVRGGSPPEMLKEFTKAFSYSVKPQDFASHPATGIQLADLLYRTRRVYPSGLFRELSAELRRQKGAKS